MKRLLGRRRGGGKRMLGRPSGRWQNYIKMGLREVG